LVFCLSHLYFFLHLSSCLSPLSLLSFSHSVSTLCLSSTVFLPLVLPSVSPPQTPSLCLFPLVSFSPSILICLPSLSLPFFSPLSLSTLSFLSFFPLFLSSFLSPSVYVIS
jgi:hypothetical protein